MSKCTDIRNALKAIYTAMPGIATVYLGRQRSIPVHALPAICIYTENEEKALAHMGKPRVFDRGMDLVSEIHVQASTTQAAEELLDTLCAAREVAILNNETLGGLVDSILPVLDEYEIDEDGRKPAGVAECRDNVTYQS